MLRAAARLSTLPGAARSAKASNRARGCVLPAAVARLSTTAPAATESAETLMKTKLELALDGSATVTDVSGGCGAMYKIEIESPQFKGVSMVKQHRMVQDLLKVSSTFSFASFEPQREFSCSAAERTKQDLSGLFSSFSFHRVPRRRARDSYVSEKRKKAPKFRELSSKRDATVPPFRSSQDEIKAMHGLTLKTKAPATV